MENSIKKKIELSNKVYPYWAALTDDIMFWAAINTIFLTTVKGFNASQISMLSAIAVFSAIILQGVVFKIIKKVGNIKSVRLGLVMLLIAATIITFAKKIYIVSIGQIIYHLSFYFISMGSVILKRNLKAVNREEDFSKIQTKVSFMYATITMFISFIAGFVFNINNYLPMMLGIIICAFNIFFSKYIYEYKSEEVEEINKKDIKVNWNMIIVLIILIYGALYATVETLQENGKIFIQYNLQGYVELTKTSIYLTFIIALSRISRVLANLFYNKIYKLIKGKMIVVLNALVIVSIFCMLLGNFIGYNSLGTTIMAIGFCVLLFARDPIMIFSKTELLNNCEVKDQEIVIHRFNLARKVVRCVFATLVSLILLKFEMKYIMLILFFAAISYLSLTISLCGKLKKIK